MANIGICQFCKKKQNDYKMFLLVQPKGQAIENPVKIFFNRCCFDCRLTMPAPQDSVILQIWWKQVCEKFKVQRQVEPDFESLTWEFLIE